MKHSTKNCILRRVFLIALFAAAASPTAYVSGEPGDHQSQFCTRPEGAAIGDAACDRPSSVDHAAAADTYGEKSADANSACLEWSRAEAASELVPDWLDRLRSHHPCPADATAASVAVERSEWRTDFCCSSSDAGWLSAPYGWLKVWLCGGSDCGFHVGADFCVRSQPLSLPDGTSAGQQCCYHGSNGRLLTDPRLGAGTADRRTDMFGHWSEDVKPFLACCQVHKGGRSQLALSSARCAVYFSRRPANTGAPQDAVTQGSE